MTELMLDTDLSSEQRRYLTMVKDSGDALLRIVNDILDFSKIEAGKLDLESVDFGLRDTVEGTLSTLRLRATAKGLRMTCDVRPDVPDALAGDPARLRQIIVNLVSNAIKFTDRGEVAVRIELQQQTEQEVGLHFAVSDTGIGIPPEEQSRIFDAFEQADASLTRKHGGTGLGLAISGRLVGMMGGRIWVEAEQGRGSTFHFTTCLGLSRNPPAQPPAAADGPAPKTHRPLRILLAEDSQINQEYAVHFLTRWGHTVVVAGDGSEALAAVEREPFDLVLMDVRMPEMSGLEATAAIREKEQATGEHLLIVAMTAHASSADREKCLEAGMDGYISKPIKPAGLFEAVESFAGGDKKDQAASTAPPTGSPNDSSTWSRPSPPLTVMKSFCCAWQGCSWKIRPTGCPKYGKPSTTVMRRA